jgi:hypothetical protein
LTKEKFEHIIYSSLKRGIMVKIARSKYISLFLVFSFILFYSPLHLAAADVETGNLIGTVYEPDRTTPLEGAVLMLRNVSTGAVYESSESNSLGTVRIEGVERGLYITGIDLGDEHYNLNNLIGIRANKTAKVSVALDPGAQEQEGGEKSEDCPRGEWYIPETEGVCDEGYEWNPDNNRCDCKKKKGLFAFFLTPAGIAIISAFALGATIGVVTLVDTTPDASPYR